MYREFWKYGLCKIEILWKKVTDLPVSRIIKSYVRKLDYININSNVNNSDWYFNFLSNLQ